MIKAITLIHLVLWGGLLLGGILRLPEQFHRLIVHRSEVPTHAD